MTWKLAAALLAGTAIIPATPAFAQEPAPVESPEPEAPDADDSAADAVIANTAAVDDAQAKIELLQAQVESLQESLEALKGQVAAATPSWKGAPLLENKEEGWSFKPRGRVMYDMGWVSSPGDYSNPGLGYSNEVRRARLGVEGKMPGDIGYKFEVDVATGDVEFADAFLSYAPGDVEFIVGQHNNFQSLEELTSSLHSSFIERAAFTDAFGFERRVGVSATYAKNDFILSGGVFTDSIADLNTVGDDNNGVGFDARAVYAPKMGSNQLHFGASFHYRDLKDSALTVRYRQRPLIHSTDVRFIDTGNIAGAESETGIGLEAAGIFGSFYTAGEAYWQKVGRDDGFDNASFFGAYADVGYFFTGETRGYKGGKFDRVKVLKPFGKGGWGSLGANLRFDYLDLNDGGAGIIGGTQKSYQASLNWKPTDYVMFGLNYAHIVYDDAAINAATPPAVDRNYSVDVWGLRSQVDF